MLWICTKEDMKISSNYLFISDLRPNITDKLQEHVTVTRMWTTYNPSTDRVLSLYLLLGDENVSLSHELFLTLQSTNLVCYDITSI